MNSSDLPILYSFRRCPYAMRARLAIASSGFCCELREVVLRDKPSQLLALSPKGTVPVLNLADGTVLEESMDIMLYVLNENDPENLLPDSKNRDATMALIEENDGPFKTHLDRTKYADRLEKRGEYVDVELERHGALGFLHKLDGLLSQARYLSGDKLTLSDLAIFPFVRQFIHVDEAWFMQQNLKLLARWFVSLRASARFAAIMHKYDKWQEGQPAQLFPKG